MTIDKIFGISKGDIGIVRNKIVKVQDVCNKSHRDDGEAHFQIDVLLRWAISLHNFASVWILTEKRIFIYNYCRANSS